MFHHSTHCWGAPGRGKLELLGLAAEASAAAAVAARCFHHIRHSYNLNSMWLFNSCFYSPIYLCLFNPHLHLPLFTFAVRQHRLCTFPRLNIEKSIEHARLVHGLHRVQQAVQTIVARSVLIIATLPSNSAICIDNYIAVLPSASWVYILGTFSATRPRAVLSHRNCIQAVALDCLPSWLACGYPNLTLALCLRQSRRPSPISSRK